MKDIKEKGKKQLQIIFGIRLLHILIMPILFLTFPGIRIIALIVSIIFIVIALAVFNQIFKKKKWVKTLVAIWFLLMGLAALQGMIEGSGFIYLMGSVFYITSGIILLASKSIKAYMDESKEISVEKN